ncbi:hypothetical protein D3C84_676540 [compost metagenome]
MARRPAVADGAGCAHPGRQGRGAALSRRCAGCLDAGGPHRRQRARWSRGLWLYVGVPGSLPAGGSPCADLLPPGDCPARGGLSQPLSVRLAGGRFRRRAVRARGLPRAGPRLRVLCPPEHPGRSGAPPAVRLAGAAGGERDEPAHHPLWLDPSDELPAGAVLAGRLALPAAGGGARGIEGGADPLRGGAQGVSGAGHRLGLARSGAWR